MGGWQWWEAREERGKSQETPAESLWKETNGFKDKFDCSILPILVKLKEDAYIHVKENAYIHFQNAGTSVFQV